MTRPAACASERARLIVTVKDPAALVEQLKHSDDPASFACDDRVNGDGQHALGAIACFPVDSGREAGIRRAHRDVHDRVVSRDPAGGPLPESQSDLGDFQPMRDAAHYLVARAVHQVDRAAIGAHRFDGIADQR
jgi:hypothetical protein